VGSFEANEGTRFAFVRATSRAIVGSSARAKWIAHDLMEDGRMDRRALLGLGNLFALALASACSSSTSSPLGGGPTGGGGGDAGDPCPTGTAASDGKGYVASRNCAKCHNADMAGSQTALTSAQIGTTIPSNVYLYPPNLTPDQTTGIGSWSDTDIKFAIIHGVDNTGANLCPQMQHYVGMCDNEATGIVAYMRSLPAVSKQIPGSICPPYKTGTPPASTDGG
jgi:mono/diheme cytochrome c family protein